MNIRKMDFLLLFTSILGLKAVVSGDEMESSSYNNTVIEDESAGTPSKLLSRRKRYLIFPDGSSFQLVFCTQNHGYLQIGDIVWFGNTAALAWELPSDPEVYNMFKENKKIFGNRRQDASKHILYLDDNGKVIGKVPYHRRPIVNPAFAKRSIAGEAPKDNNMLKTIPVKDMHEKEVKRNNFENLNPNRVDYHRESRKNLYGKLEKMLEGLGWNGRECVLRLLCQTGKGHYENGQGTFLQEIVRATFTLPQGRGFDSQQHKEYDIAHRSSADCNQLYPACLNLSAL